MGMTKRSKGNGKAVAKAAAEIRCPECGYFIAEQIGVEGDDFMVILKIVCRSCRGRMLLKLSPEEALIGQI